LPIWQCPAMIKRVDTSSSRHQELAEEDCTLS
jgi:hypothetical protein